MTSHGDEDIFVLKLTNTGDFIWSKSMGGGDLDCGYDITTDAAMNIFVAGQYWDTADFDPGTSDYILSPVGPTSAFILKLDTQGNLVWANSYGIDSRAITTDPDGTSYISGIFSGLTHFGSNPSDTLSSTYQFSGFIQKIDQDGNNLWVKALQCDSSIFFTEIIKSGTDDLFLSGCYYRQIDFDPDPNNTFIQYSVDSTGDGFLIKLTESGQFEWSFTIGGENIDLCESVTVDSHNNIYASGDFYEDCNFSGNVGNLYSNGENDMFILKLGSTANTISNQDELDIQIYPNPTNNNVNILIENGSTAELEVFDNSGRLIYNAELTEPITKLNLSSFENGIYLFRLISEKRYSIKKIIKE